MAPGIRILDIWARLSRNLVVRNENGIHKGVWDFSYSSASMLVPGNATDIKFIGPFTNDIEDSESVMADGTDAYDYFDQFDECYFVIDATIYYVDGIMMAKDIVLLDVKSTYQW